MENLNAEQVKKALECCYMQELEHNENCPECPYTDLYPDCAEYLGKRALALINSQEQRIGAQDMTISELRKRVEKAEHDADRYARKIKELTEENERLRVDVAKEFTCVFGTPHKVSDCPINDEVAKAKADTVRKMLSLLHEKKQWARNDICDMECVDNDDIDQIAKEMEEHTV